MRVCKRILLAVLLAGTVPALSFSQEQQHKFRPSENYQLHGPIHTQLDISRQLNPDPRGKDYKLHIREQKSWVEFDESGEITAEGHLDESGKPTNIVRRIHDPQGHETETIITDRSKTTELHTERSKNEGGDVETRSFADGKLLSHIVSTFDPQKHEGESQAFDSKGEVTHHSISRREADRTEVQSWNKEGTLVIHSEHRFDSNGEMIESLRYDAEGKVVSDFTLQHGILTSWWQDPNCKCTNVAAYNWAGDRTVFYKTEPDGKLVKTIQHHKGRRTNHEIDDEELYDQDDHLLERIEYRYECDEHDNWTKRTTSVLDSKTGTMVDVREDKRTLVYY